jgi:peroxiredoxin|tara:strand:- start:106 stop:606 length:501 start_codon:yes stop_codon:yes gene_type:complete
MSLFEFDDYGIEHPTIPTAEAYITNVEDSYAITPLNEYVDKRRVIMIGIPGAFTPTCTEKHLPGFLESEDKFYAKGVDEIMCLSVNDVHVMTAFDDYINSEGGQITMVADPHGNIAKQLNLLVEKNHLGMRMQRFVAICKDGKIIKMLVDEKGLDVSSAENCLRLL